MKFMTRRAVLVAAGDNEDLELRLRKIRNSNLSIKRMNKLLHSLTNEVSNFVGYFSDGLA